MRSSRLNGFVAAAGLGLVAATAAPLDAQAGSQSVTQSGGDGRMA
jgi:hypothetical protein